MVRCTLIFCCCLAASALAQSEHAPPPPLPANNGPNMPAPPAPDAGAAKPALIDNNAAEAGQTDGGTVVLNPNEKYGGVSPGGSNLPPHPPKLPVKGGRDHMTWLGFQIRDNIPTVFIELTGVPDYQVNESGGVLHVELKRTHVPLRNNRRPLDLAAFDAPISRVEAKVKGHFVDIEIQSKSETVPTHHERIETAAGGLQMLVIEFPR